jgi:hypothetical protein
VTGGVCADRRSGGGVDLSGWIGLSTVCGFGFVAPLPVIAPGCRLDTAIALRSGSRRTAGMHSAPG